MNKVYELIKQHECTGDFTHATITEERLRGVEKRLGIKIPIEYESFLKEFGHGGIGGIEVLGIGKNGALIFEKETLKYRAYGLPNELIIIENCDEWVYCVNSIDGKVVMWSTGIEGYAEVFDGFEAYLYDRVNDILENM